MTNELERLKKTHKQVQSYKKRATKIEMYGLENRVINMIAQNKSYEEIARRLTRYMHNRKKNPVPGFSIKPLTVQRWWMENHKDHSLVVNEMRNALIEQRHYQFLDEGIERRRKVIKELEKDADLASSVAESSFDHESVARIRVKEIDIQESGEKAISKQSPTLNLTQININPIEKFSKMVSEALEDEDDKDDDKVVDIDFEDIEVIEDEDDDEDDENSTDRPTKKKEEEV